MPRLSGHFSFFGLVFFVLKSLLGIARQWSLEKFAILTLKPRSHTRISIYRTYFCKWGFKFSARESKEKSWMCPDTLGDASDIYNQTKTPTCSMFFLFYRTFAFFLSNIKKRKVKVKVARPSLACEIAPPKSLFWDPTCQYKVLKRRYDWPVKKSHCIVDLPIRMKGNSKCTSSNSLSPAGAQNKDIGAALQTLLTEFKLRLRRRLDPVLQWRNLPSMNTKSKGASNKENEGFRLKTLQKHRRF